MDIIDEKPNKLNILTKRELERQINLQKKKENRELLSADNEKLGFFETIFSEKQSYIESLINSSPKLPKNELPNHFNYISNEILTLQKYVSASTIFLRHYDLKKCQDILQELSTKSKDYEDELLPKKKFGFKNKAKQKTVNKSFNGNNKYDEVDSNPISHLIENSCGFFHKQNETLRMSNSDIFKKDVSVEHLENCTVIFKGSPSTLHLNHLKNCKVFSGPVSTSVFAENCVNSTLVIACQQLRLHSSNNVNIYLHVTSRAIMEDCKEIRIAPYNWHYRGIENDFESACLDISINNWRSIDDFNWLSDKHSPNWRVIEEKDRVKKWDTVE